MFRRVRDTATSLIVLLSVCQYSIAQTPAIEWSLDDAIDQIDSQISNFDTAMSNCTFMTSTSDSDSSSADSQSGICFFSRNGDMRIEFSDNNRISLIDRNSFYNFNREANRLDQYSIRHDSNHIEAFYNLGFSVSGREMRDRYLVTILGEEEFNNTRTLVLELTPQEERDRELFRSVEIWIDQASWLPRRQRFLLTASNETLEINYSDIARNLHLNPALFRADWPRGIERIRH